MGKVRQFRTLQLHRLLEHAEMLGDVDKRRVLIVQTCFDTVLRLLDAGIEGFRRWRQTTGVLHDGLPDAITKTLLTVHIRWLTGIVASTALLIECAGI